MICKKGGLEFQDLGPLAIEKGRFGYISSGAFKVRAERPELTRHLTVRNEQCDLGAEKSAI